METIDLYLLICKVVYALNRIICFETRIEAKTLSYNTFAFYKDKIGAHMAAIAYNMIYELKY